MGQGFGFAHHCLEGSRRCRSPAELPLAPIAGGADFCCAQFLAAGVAHTQREIERGTRVSGEESKIQREMRTTATIPYLL